MRPALSSGLVQVCQVPHEAASCRRHHKLSVTSAAAAPDHTSAVSPSQQKEAAELQAGSTCLCACPAEPSLDHHSGFQLAGSDAACHPHHSFCPALGTRANTEPRAGRQRLADPQGSKAVAARWFCSMFMVKGLMWISRADTQDHEHWVLPGATVRQVRGPRQWMGLRPGRRMQLIDPGPWWTPSGDESCRCSIQPQAFAAAVADLSCICPAAKILDAASGTMLTATQALSRSCRLEGSSIQPQPWRPAGPAGCLHSRHVAAQQAVPGETDLSPHAGHGPVWCDHACCQDAYVLLYISSCCAAVTANTCRHLSSSLRVVYLCRG